MNPSGAAIPAARIMLERIEQMIERNQSFAIETTLSGSAYLGIIRKAKANRFAIILLYVYLNSTVLAVERVAIRVSKGGHNIPNDVIERRYRKGLKNFSRYAVEVNEWYVYDNSGNGYKLVASCANNDREIINFELFKIVSDDQ